MQGDLISRSAVLDELRKLTDMEEYGNSVSDIGFGLTMAVNRVRIAPAVDAVPVVRCRECKRLGGYYCPMYHTETSLDDLDGFDDYSVDKTDGDGFCHRGVRRDGNAD